MPDLNEKEKKNSEENTKRGEINEIENGDYKLHFILWTYQSNRRVSVRLSKYKIGGRKKKI